MLADPPGEGKGGGGAGALDLQLKITENVYAKRFFLKSFKTGENHNKYRVSENKSVAQYLLLVNEARTAALLLLPTIRGFKVTINWKQW